MLGTNGGVASGAAGLAAKLCGDMVAMMFILFDIEAVFLLPWAVVFKSLSEKLSRPFVYAEMMVFLVVLLIGYIYVWKKGVFEWNRG